MIGLLWLNLVSSLAAGLIGLWGMQTMVIPAVKLVRSIQDRADQIAIDRSRPTLPIDLAVTIPSA